MAVTVSARGTVSRIALSVSMPYTCTTRAVTDTRPVVICNASTTAMTPLVLVENRMSPTCTSRPKVVILPAGTVTSVPTTSLSASLVRKLPLPVSPLSGVGRLRVTVISVRSLTVATRPNTPSPPEKVSPLPRLVGLAATSNSPETSDRL